MRRTMAWALMVLLASRARAQVVTLDSFESLEGWTVVASDGVVLRPTLDEGRHGRALRIDYDFTRGTGYGIVRKQIGVLLPRNYRFTYSIRGVGPSNTIEFKLVDPSGENVWWVNQRDFQFPDEWKTVSLKKRHFSFAWGPAGAGAGLKEARFLEIAVTATTGGKGTVWLDDLGFEALPEEHVYAGVPRVVASSVKGGGDLALG